MEDDPNGAFSQTLEGVLNLEDIRAYIHKLELIGESDIGSELDKVYNDDKFLIPEFAHLANLNILQCIDHEEFEET